MYIKFGNLSAEKFAEIVGAEFTEEELQHLNKNWSRKADLTGSEDFHIFDDPAISINVGSTTSETIKIFIAANARKTFSRSITFHLDENWTKDKVNA